MLTRREALLAGALTAIAGPALTACGSEGASTGRAGAEVVSSDVRRAPADPAALPAAVASVHALGAGLWQRIATEKDGNVAVSPYSVAVALAMTVNGADGATRQEMLDVLGADSEAVLNRGLNALTRHVESLADRKVALDAANQLFGQRGVSWERAFLDVLARQYGAGLRTVDFIGATAAARTAVNDWTSDRTHGRIPEILDSDAVSPLTRLVLVNALYFKAPWLEPFAEPLTEPADFRLSDGTSVQVPTMRATLTGSSYGVGDGWASVRLPYVGGRLAMTIVLPDLGREVDVAALPAILAAAVPAPVSLSLPRWTFRTQVALGATLAGLGMPSVFDEARADLTRMTDTDEHLLVDDVHHEAYVAVDEEGTEAAAATAVVVRTVSAQLGERVVVDRPFLFVVHDVEHGTPLFLGRVSDPRA